MKLRDAAAIIFLGIPLGVFVVVQLALFVAMILGAPFAPIVTVLVALTAAAALLCWLRR